MAVYVSIAILGCLLKLFVACYVLRSSSEVERHLRPMLVVCSVLIVSYSVPQVLLLAPDSWASAIGLSRAMVLRIYYYHGTLCLISSIYISFSLLNLRFHRSLWMLTIIGVYALIGGFYILGTDWLVASNYERVPFQQELSSSKVSPAVFLTRLAVVIILTVILLGFIRAYRDAKSNQAQIANFYAVAAGMVFYLNCVSGLFISHPLIFSIRGLFFFVATMMFAIDKKKFDARPHTPATYEHKVLTELQSIFRRFANQKIGYREAVREIEINLVSYKLKKITGFERSDRSSLPEVAKNMQVSLSSLYDLLKKHELDKPRKKN